MNTIDALNARFQAVFANYAPLVLGEGNERARLMLIGEAPGAHEIEQGRPFVGTAGKNLDAFLQAVNLPREALYITNAVKFRPTKPSARGQSNRMPTSEEIRRFRPWLLEEIKAVSPAIIATMGITPLFSVLGKFCSIAKVHGWPLPFADVEPAILFPLYHPAAVIYRRDLMPVLQADMERLGAFLEGEGRRDTPPVPITG